MPEQRIAVVRRRLDDLRGQVADGTHDAGPLLATALEALAMAVEDLCALASEHSEKLTATSDALVVERQEKEDLLPVLRDSEARFRSLSTCSPVGILLTTIDGRNTYMNPQGEAIWGRSAEEALGMGWVEAVHPDDRDAVFESWTASAARGDRYSREIRFLTPEGVTRWVHARSAPMLDDAGHLIGHVGTIEDITERKHAAEKLEASEERFRSLVASAQDAIVVTDLDATIGFVNDAGCRLWGADDASELIGHNAFAYLDEESQSPAREGLALVLAEGSARYRQYVLIRRDGTKTPVEMSVSLLRGAHGEAVGFMSIARDSSERKRFEEALEHSATRLRLLTEQMPMVLWTTDTELRFTSALGAGLRHIGFKPGEVEGHSLLEYAERNDAEPIAVHRRALRGAPGMYDHERMGRWFVCHVEPLRNAGGVIIGTIGVAHDVTEEHEMREKVEQQARLAAVGQLAAGVAHDFNNILTVVIGVADRLKMDAALDGKVRGLMNLVAQQGRRGGQLIRQILDFSRRSLVSDHERIELGAFVHETGKLLERTIPERVLIDIVCTLGEHFVDANPVQLQEILTNLALNACDAMPGAGLLQMRTSRLTLLPGQRPPLAHLPAGEWIVLSVADTGTGMPPEVLRHAFEPFFTTKESGSGTGLGLAQVYGLVKQHNGFIDASSEIGGGTTFTIYLPVAAAESPTVPLSVADDVPRGLGETILVVEDEASVRKVNTWLLNDLGYRAIAAASGDEGLELYQRHRDEIALVLMDMVMPGMGGGALLNALHQEDASLPIVVLSGYALGSGSHQHLRRAPHSWLPKPPEPHLLARALRLALDSRKAVAS